MLDKMLGITIGQTIVILMKIITSSLYHQDVDSSPNEVMVSLGVKEIKTLMNY